MKKTIFTFLILCLMFLVVGCANNTTTTKKATTTVDGGGNDTSSVTTTKSQYATWAEAKANRVEITIYVDESNVYGPYVKGVDENVVEEAIEKKFWEDTGLAIKLNILYESHSTFSNTFGAVMAASSWDACVSYLGQAGIEETILNQDVTLDITSLLRQYGSHIVESLGEDSLNAVTSYNDTIIGIPSQNITKQKAVLIRKDYMTQVGYTESKEEAETSNGTLIWCRTITDFDTMVRKMKAEIPACTTPLSGSVYDMEFTLLAGCMDSTGYQYRSINYNADGSIKEVVPGWISENYGKVLAQEYDWVTDGIWETDNMTISANARLSNFAAGKSAVYFADPTITNLIDVARRCKEIDPTAEFTILDPLDAVDENGNAIENSGAFVEVSKNTDCILFNKRSKRVPLLIQYIDWMYSSKENYELCAYGIKGEHWIESEYGDDYYEYADEYFVTHKPYSGVFALLHNDELSYRIPMQYTETERAWIQKARSYRCFSNPTDGMLFYGASSQITTNFTTAEADIYLYCATLAWAGTKDPRTTWTSSCDKYREQASDYIEWLTNQYKLYRASR